MAILVAYKHIISRAALTICLLSSANAFLHPVHAEEIKVNWQQAQQNKSTDPLKGLDLQELEAEKQRLLQLKSHPEAAALLSVVPGAGHFYAGQNTRGAWVLGGFASTLLLSFLSSYLLSSIDHDIARTAAVVVNVAPTSAYWAWSISDAYYQTTLQNHMIDRQIQEISLKQKEYGFYSTLFKIHF